MEMTVFSVYEVTLHLKQVIETQIEELYVSGEVSNFVHHGSGHMYFNLKDENATMRCTFFKGANYSLSFRPEDGMQVVCYGKLTVFEKGGTYNLNVRQMSLSGKGNMSQSFELLKQKLMKEGLFDNSFKQKLPPYPSKIGIVTSPTGAALQDISNILKRRYPIHAIVYPALVQGNEAAIQIVEGIRYFNEYEPVDVIIITRGGGSQEDLFCFNDEILARAIFKSKTPVISAVGHEIDFTIADFVADLRAPTPSAAAELVVPDKKDLLALLSTMRSRVKLSFENVVNRNKATLSEKRLVLNRFHPEKLIQSYQQRFDMASMKLMAYESILKNKRHSFEIVQEKALAGMHRTLLDKFYKNKQSIAECTNSMERSMIKSMSDLRRRYEHSSLVFEQLSPRIVLKRGYAIVHKNDKLISSVDSVTPGDRLMIIVTDGEISTDVQAVQNV